MNYSRRLFLVVVVVHVIVAIPYFGELYEFVESINYISSNQFDFDRVKRSPKGNQDRGLGFKKGKSKSKSKRNYPWDSSGAQGKVQLHIPESLQKHVVKDEEPFEHDYYDDYDFEFTKGMVKKGNWDTKSREMLENMIE